MTLGTPAPHLKSVDLSWSSYPDDGTFQRYEIYRRESSGVTLADTCVAIMTNRQTQAMTDTGLSIGKTYYYKVFVVNSNDTYSASNEADGTTVPIALPVVDSFDDMSLWDTLGGWGIETNGAEGFLSDSPGVQYANSLNSGNNYALSAVDLTEVDWPALSFRDRHAFYSADAGDRGILEVSPNGSSWTRVYGVTGTREGWAEQRIDLSPWRGEPNLRIRFYLESNSSLAGEGWFVDDFSVEEHAAGGMQTLPFAARFEAGLTNWIAGGWVASTNSPYEGTGCARDLPSRWSPAKTESWLSLNRELDLSGAADPQITLWARGLRGYNNYGRLYVYLSKDGGVTWRDISNVLDFDTQWTRFQYSVPSDYRVAGVRLVIRSYTHQYEMEKELYIDKLTVEEAPQAVTLGTPSDVSVNGMTLSWSRYAGSAFQYYKVFRHTAENVNESHTPLAVITDSTVTNFVDSGLSARTRYFYKVYVYDESDTGSASNEASSQTLGVPLGWSDDFESAQPDPAWTFTGTWGLQSGAGVAGSTALTDSPGDYAHSSDTWAQTAVDLSDAVWPALVFKDRHALPPSGDNAYLQIGAANNDNIASIAWTTVYSVRESRTEWKEQKIDLSSWKGHHTVYIRFRLSSNSSVVDDGWALDDVAVREHTPGAETDALYERFEDGLGNWINGGWIVSSNSPWEGAASALNHASQYVQAYTDSWLVYGSELDLSTATDPKVTFWTRGWRGYLDRGRLYLRLSKDGGATWLDLSGIIAVEEEWTRFQYAVPAEYRTNGIRVAIQSYAYSSDLDSAFYIDSFGVGEEIPGAPAPVSPVDGATVSVYRPVLTVTNAVDTQTDPLTYAFEVYYSADLDQESLVAQNPAIASGAFATFWELDTDLVDGSRYWWRCRASDGAYTGPWMATASFYVNHINSAPLPVVLAGPPPDSILHDLTHELAWKPTVDTNAGDIVSSYHLQVDASSAFTNPVVDDAAIAVSGTTSGSQWRVAMPLSSFSGSEALVENTLYFWRMRACDQWNAWSDWSAENMWFIFGTPPPTINTFATSSQDTFDLSWERSGKEVVMEFSPSLNETNWQVVAGPVTATNWTLELPEGHSSGFFRIRTQD